MEDQVQRLQPCPGRDGGYIIAFLLELPAEAAGEGGRAGRDARCLHGQTRERLGFMGRDGWEVGLSKLGMRRKGEETVCGKDPGIKVTWVVFAGTLGSERHATHSSRSPQGSLTCRSLAQVWLDPGHQDSTAFLFSDFSTRDIIAKEEKSG